MNYLDYIPREEKPYSGIILRICAFLYKMFFSSIRFIFNRVNIKKNKIAVFAWTKNQNDALLPLIEKLSGYSYIGLNNFGDCSFPIWKAYIYSIVHFPHVFKEYIRSKEFLRRSFLSFFDKYWLTYGYYKIARTILRKINPVVFISSNDHHPNNRIFYKAAKDQNIATIYIQHASVTENFPQLSFNYAFLDGEDAARKYDSINENSNVKVYLCGFSKFDKYYPFINNSKEISRIGICSSILDSIEIAEEIICNIRDDYDVVLRPHPGDLRMEEWRKLSSKYHVEFSDSRCADSFEFLRNVDCIIASESGIHLEAAMMNVYPIGFDMLAKKNLFDFYGFLKNGLLTEYCKTVKNLRELLAKLKNGKPNIRRRAKKYNAVIETKYDGASSYLYKSLIDDIVENETISNKEWILRSDFKNFKCYQLK